MLVKYAALAAFLYLVSFFIKSTNLKLVVIYLIDILIFLLVSNSGVEATMGLVFITAAIVLNFMYYFAGKNFTKPLGHVFNRIDFQPQHGQPVSKLIRRQAIGGDILLEPFKGKFHKSQASIEKKLMLYVLNRIFCFDPAGFFTVC